MPTTFRRETSDALKMEQSKPNSRKNNAIVPKCLSNESLTRKPRSRFERWRLILEHRYALKKFNFERRIPEVAVEELFPGIIETRAIMQRSTMSEASWANVSPYELIVLATVCGFRKPHTIFEFGTYNGVTTLHFALNSPPHTQILTLDLEPDSPLRERPSADTDYTKGIIVGEHFIAQPEGKRITQCFGNSSEWDHMPLKGKVDFVFVDGGHSKEVVESDSQKAIEMAAPNSVIFWHDYHYAHIGVYAYLNGLADRLNLHSVYGTSLVCCVLSSKNE